MAGLRFFYFFSIFLALHFSNPVSAQGHKITGRIVDAETLDPLPYAHVFIDQTTLGGVSDINGEFTIENLANGEYKLVFSFVGYELFYKTVTINGSDVRASARMAPQLEMLQAVEVKGAKDKEWEKQVKKFNKIFFGESEFAKDCKVLNPWVLDFRYDEREKRNVAVAVEPLKFENMALGYAVTCNLQLFSFDKESYKIKGLFKFEEINTLDTKQANRWTRNRRLAYQNSLRFLMKSIVDKHERENGFDLYLDKRPAKYISTSGYFANELEKNLEAFSASNSLTPTGKPGIYKLLLDKRIEVHHTTQFARQKTYRDVTHPVSWIEVEGGFVMLGHDGNIQSSEKVVTSGEFNNYRIAGMLPSNYSPGSFVVVNYLTKRNHAKRLQERVFVQTDKTMYYPGERIWFKAHVNYANPSLRDSLSRVLYVELINDSDSILNTTMLKVDSLGAAGNMLLDASCATGHYRMRAYTQWMQNYGPDGISYSKIFVSPSNRRYILADDSTNLYSGDFKIAEQGESHDSLIYHVLLDSTNFQDWASCVVSMAPAASGLPNLAKSMKENLLFAEDLPNGTLGDFTFPLEQKFSVWGKVEHPKKKVSRVSMTVIKGMMDSLYTLKTDRKGVFKLTGFDFYDTTTFSFQARDKKGRIFGSTKLISKGIPAVPIVEATRYAIYDTINLPVPVQLFESKVDSIPMSISKSIEFSSEKIYSNADYVLREDDLKNMPEGLNIITALVGRVPGLQYNATSRKLTFRNAQVGTRPNTEPLIVLDGIPFYSTQSSKEPEMIQTQSSKQESSTTPDNFQQSSQEVVAQRQNVNLVNQQSQVETQDASSVVDMLSHLNVGGISRVEINSRTDARYGSLGAYGVISIYTKKVQNKRESEKTMDFFAITGYQKPERFSVAVNFSATDQQNYFPTIYWNPDFVIRTTAPNRIALPRVSGSEIYRVTIAGVTKAGVPVFGEFLIYPNKEKPLRASLDQRQK